MTIKHKHGIPSKANQRSTKQRSFSAEEVESVHQKKAQAAAYEITAQKDAVIVVALKKASGQDVLDLDSIRDRCERVDSEGNIETLLFDGRSILRFYPVVVENSRRGCIPFTTYTQKYAFFEDVKEVPAGRLGCEVLH